MRVRQATVDDVPAIVATGDRFVQDTVYREALADNPAQRAHFVTWLVTTPDGAVWVLEDQDTVVGILGGMIYAHPMDGRRTAAEMFWWVDPGARGHGLKLLRAFERWAVAQEAEKVVVAAPSSEVERLCERLHYVKREVSYERMTT